MPRFYFHFRDGEEFVEDPAGLELADIAAARLKAIATLRRIVADDVLAGVLNTGAAIEIEDARSCPMGRISVAEILTIRS